MIVTVWNNGKHHQTGAGYGIKINPEDRDSCFDPLWQEIFLYLDKQQPISVNIGKASFWNDTCYELIHKEIGKWLIQNNLAPWHKGNPPKLNLTPLGENRFRLEIR